MSSTRTILLTGATSGIGLALAEALAQAGHHTLLVGRDPLRLTDAVARARARAAPGVQVRGVEGDLASVRGARQAAERLAAEPFDVLVHCAGVWPTHKVLTEDGFEVSFAVNHLAPFLLNDRLIPLLRERPGGRVVQVSAGLALRAPVDLDADPSGGSFHALRTYGATKLWNLLATLHRAAEMAGGPVTLNAVHPGVVRTRLGDTDGPLGLILRFVKRFWMTPEQGAAAPLALAIAPEHEGTHGVYFHEKVKMALPPALLDPALSEGVVSRTRALLAQHG